MQTSLTHSVLMFCGMALLAGAIAYHGRMIYQAAGVPECTISTVVDAHGRQWSVSYTGRTNGMDDARISAAEQIALTVDYSISDPKGHLSRNLRTIPPSSR